jgi:hypothetical protein
MAIATGTACCAATLDALIEDLADRGRQIRRFGAAAGMLSKPLRFSFPIVGKTPPGIDESSRRDFT